MSSSNLVGTNASFFMDGGWEISGKVINQESDKIILEKDGELFLLFKEKVNFVKLNSVDKPLASKNVGHISDREDLEDDSEDDMSFPENGISYSETFMNIPRSLLGKPPQDDGDDFSVSFKESMTNNVLNFKVEDDSR